jgi:hypothetical protein
MTDAVGLSVGATVGRGGVDRVGLGGIVGLGIWAADGDRAGDGDPAGAGVVGVPAHAVSRNPRKRDAARRFAFIRPRRLG